MGKHIHILLSKDIEAKRGVCAKCGEVRLRKKGTVWHCQIGQSPHRGGKSIKEYRSKEPHGLTREEAAVMREGKRCQICGSPDRLMVDHCHRKNIIRGVLCSSCNSGLGFFKDDPDLLIKALEYLARVAGVEPALHGFGDRRATVTPNP